MIIFQIICITYELDKCPSEIGLGRGQTPQYGIFFVQDSGEPALAIPDVQSAIFRAIP